MSRFASRPADGKTMRTRHLALALLAIALPVSAVQAHHPGARLDEVMGSREKYFEAIDRPAPTFRLIDTEGKPVALSDHADKVVVLHFIYAHCPDICPLHTAKLAQVQAMIDQTPMKDRAQFIGITTDPTKDTAEVLDTYGANHGLDRANAAFLTKRPGQSESATRSLAEAFGHKFVRAEDGYQTHSIVTHIIDRGGRWAANFHGLRFEPVNMVLYVNGLINNANAPDVKPETGWWDKLKALFD